MIALSPFSGAVCMAVCTAVSALWCLGSVGNELTVRVTDREASAPVTASRGAGRPDLDCTGFVVPARASGGGIRRITATGTGRAARSPR